MQSMFKQYWSAWLGFGLVLGLVVSGVWPRTPLHGVGTDRADNGVMCTVPVDGEVEAVFYLDSLTSTLRGGVPSRQLAGLFQATWERNVAMDLSQAVTRLNGAGGKAAKGGATRPEIQLPQSPKYLMVSGLMDIPGRAQLRPSRAMLYVAEVNTGIVLAYVIPWSAGNHAANQRFTSPLELWAAAPFASTLIRPEE